MTQQPRTPTTEAGKRALGRGMNLTAILAIEAEARADLLAQIEKAGTAELTKQRGLPMLMRSQAVGQDGPMRYGNGIEYAVMAIRRVLADHPIPDVTWAVDERGQAVSPEPLDVERLARAMCIAAGDTPKQADKYWDGVPWRSSRGRSGRMDRTWPSRDEVAAMSDAEVNAFLESRGLDVRVESVDAERLARAMARLAEVGPPAHLNPDDAEEHWPNYLTEATDTAAEYARLSGDPSGADVMDDVERLRAAFANALPCNRLRCEQIGTNVQDDWDNPRWVCDDHIEPGYERDDDRILIRDWLAARLSAAPVEPT